jgi:hypothetical protein
MRTFYLGWRVAAASPGRFNARADRPTTDGRPDFEIWQTLSAEFPFAKPHAETAASNGPRRRQAASAKSFAVPATVTDLGVLIGAFPLSWSHYVRLLSVSDPDIRAFYESEAIRGGWSVRQLDRQVSTLFYERTALSKRKAAMLEKGKVPKPEDAATVRDEIRDPYLLEFLDLKTGTFTHADAGALKDVLKVIVGPHGGTGKFAAKLEVSEWTVQYYLVGKWRIRPVIEGRIRQRRKSANDSTMRRSHQMELGPKPTPCPEFPDSN